VTILDNYKTELFQISPESFKTASKLETFESKAHFARSAIELFPDESARYWHLVELLNLKGVSATVRQDKGRNSIVFIMPDRNSDAFKEPLFAYGVKDDACRITLGDPKRIKLDPLSDDTDFEICKRLILDQLRRSIGPRYEIGQWEIADTQKIVDHGIGKGNQLLTGVSAYRAAKFQLIRLQGGSAYFMKTTPRSMIRHRESLDSMLRKKLVAAANVNEVFPFVRLPHGGTGKLATVIEERLADDPITDDAVLAGRSFLEFAREFYPHLRLRQTDSPMAIVSTQRGPRLYSCESLYPSIRFELLESLDPQYFAKLISRLKLESVRRRLDDAIEWTAILSPRLTISTDFRVEVESTPFEISALSLPMETESLRADDFDSPGAIFARPPVSFRRLDGSGKASEFTVYPGHTPGYQGTLNDLLDHEELKPFDAPSEASVIVFVQDSLEKKWNLFSEALVRGTGSSGYRGLEETFGVKVSVKTRVVSDFLGSEFNDMVGKLDDREFDCALTVIPRFLGGPDRTRRIYTDPKIALMRKGIPVQGIADDERQTLSRDKSLVGRARNSSALFGTACNILGKVGIILTALARDFADAMLTDSAIMGYDVARVFPPIQDPAKLLRQKRTSVPLAAPLFIFDNQGARITHQKVYRPSKETLLFAEHGSEIFSSVVNVSNLIIHKDGMFSAQELEQLKELALSREHQNLRRVIPISIVKADVPRVFRPDYAGEGFELQGGTFLSLSSTEFILITTPTTKWTPENRGWPCPLWIQVHDKELGNALTTSEKLKLLYQIFALTKMHTGSQVPTKSPVSIHYSNMVARFLRRVGDPAPDFLDKFITPGPQKRFASRWYS
jgi:hypothetical protein